MTSKTDDNRARFEAIYREHEKMVLAYALRRAPVELAQDAVAEAFLVAWRRLDVLPSEPLPWLIGTTRKMLANQRRSVERQLRLVDRVEALTQTHQQSEPMPSDSTVAEALTRLSDADREAIMLIGWDGFKPAEAADSLGCSPVAFRVRFHRARRRFAHALRDADLIERARRASNSTSSTQDLEEVV
jgi:RNA polymerase sigma factor (sigma-70 family)